MAPHKKLGSIVVPNGVDMGAFADASKTIQTCDVGLCWIKKPVIGYIGDMDERIDEHAVGAIAKAFPKATVVLVGNTNYRPVIAVSEQHDNIFPVVEQPYKNLSLYLQSFDILILPLKTTCKFPLTHESLPILLSSGKPIVASLTSQVGPRWKRLLYSAKNHTALITQVKRALAESKKSKKRALRIAQARKMRWNVTPLLKV
jgi:glycosyltransferase involved in cell wall biosynthesis